MMLRTMIEAMMVRALRAAPVLALLAVLASACGDTPVDEGTASVTHRVSRDSVVLRDTLVYRDSVITRVKDSVIITLHDSLRIVIRDSVTIRFRDSVVVEVRDSVVVIRRDTLIRRFDNSAIRRGTLYYRDLSGQAASTPLVIDSASRLTIELSPGGPTGIRLDMMGRPTVDLWDEGKQRSPIPLWMRLVLPYLPIASGNGSMKVVGDPIHGPGFGVLQKSRQAQAPLWMHTGLAGASATFVVDAVDTAGRLVYARLRAEFNTPEILRIDSARVVMSY